MEGIFRELNFELLIRWRVTSAESENNARNISIASLLADFLISDIN